MTSLPPIRVLLVDDCAVVRGALGAMLEAERDIKVVSTAPNGQLALDALQHTEIDVVLLDIDMPVMDGMTALLLILAADPRTRVIMTSAPSQEGAAITMQALALGATDRVSKPPARADGATLAVAAHEIVTKVRAVGRGKKINLDPLALRAAHLPPPASIRVAGSGGDVAPRALAIASSTGGPDALADVLSGLPADFPLPTFITQHMPPVFTALLAQRLQRDTGRICVEATSGMPVQAGHTYVAPGDWHMLVHTVEGQPLIRLAQSPAENHCRPSADPMLGAIAAVYGAATLAVVLTGMGEDGRRGCEAVRARGGRVLVQDEATSVVWGMPGAVASAGLAHWILPLPEIASKIASLSCVRTD